MSHISSGREGFSTIKGSFHIIEKDRHHKSSLFGDYVDASGAVVQKDVDTTKDPMPEGAFYEGASMPNFMRIVAGTGMHEGYLPGYVLRTDASACPARWRRRFSGQSRWARQYLMESQYYLMGMARG